MAEKHGLWPWEALILSEGQGRSTEQMSPCGILLFGSGYLESCILASHHHALSLIIYRLLRHCAHTRHSSPPGHRHRRRLHKQLWPATWTRRRRSAASFFFLAYYYIENIEQCLVCLDLGMCQVPVWARVFSAPATDGWASQMLFMTISGCAGPLLRGSRHPTVILYGVFLR